MVKAVMIIEAAGQPPEHLKEALEKHISQLDKVAGVSVHHKKTSDPIEIENSKGIFTCFSEIEFEAKNLATINGVVFDFMPSSIEILEPTNVTLTALEATEVLNNISGRLHKYDEVAKIAHFKIRELTQKLKESGHTSASEKPKA